MTAASIITFIIFFIVAMIMIGLGIFQLKSTSPVGFYSGEKPPREEELTDVKAWNKKHGMMWLIYGIIIRILTKIKENPTEIIKTIKEINNDHK